MGFLSKLFGSRSSKPAPAAKPMSDEIYDFRHIKDINNVIPYQTCSTVLQSEMESYLQSRLPDCRVQSRVPASAVFEGAPDYAMPFNFIISKGDRTLAVLLVQTGQMRRYSFLETRELCWEKELELMLFYMQLPNEEDYVVERIKNALA